jgi:hypothetical protein
MGLDLSQFGGAGNKPYNWKGKSIGAFVEGTLLESRSQQQREYKGEGKPPGEPLFWKDGNPRMQLVLTIQTDERDPADERDEGARDVYLPSFGDTFKRILRAVQATGGETLEDGARVRVTWISGAGVTGDGRQFGFDYAPPAKGTNLAPLAAQAPSEPVAAPTPTLAAPAPVPNIQRAPEPAPAQPQRAQVSRAQYDQFKGMGLDVSQFDVVD